MENSTSVRYAVVLRVGSDCYPRPCAAMPYYRFLHTHEDAGEDGYCIARQTDQTTWRCDECLFVNGAHDHFCGFCGATRDGDERPEYAEYQED